MNEPLPKSDFDAWKRSHVLEHDALERRVRDGAREDFKEASEGMKRHVSEALKPVDLMSVKLDKLVATNEAQTKMLEESAKERLRRMLLEEIDATAKATREEAERKASEAAIAKSALADVDATTALKQAEAALKQADAKTRRWQAGALLVTALAALITALLSKIH